MKIWSRWRAKSDCCLSLFQSIFVIHRFFYFSFREQNKNVIHDFYLTHVRQFNIQNHFFFSPIASYSSHSYCYMQCILCYACKKFQQISWEHRNIFQTKFIFLRKNWVNGLSTALLQIIIICFTTITIFNIKLLTFPIFSKKPKITHKLHALAHMLHTPRMLTSAEHNSIIRLAKRWQRMSCKNIIWFHLLTSAFHYLWRMCHTFYVSCG